MPLIDEIRARLRTLDPLLCEITDDSALHAGHAGARDGAHFSLLIVSPAFSGRTALERHRMVHAALGELMGQRIHALALRAQSPEEADAGASAAPANSTVSPSSRKPQ